MLKSLYVNNMRIKQIHFPVDNSRVTSFSLGRGEPPPPPPPPQSLLYKREIYAFQMREKICCSSSSSSSFSPLTAGEK